MAQYKASCLAAVDLKCNDEDVMTGNYNSCRIRLYCYCFISFSSWEHKQIAHPPRKLQRTLWRMTFTHWQLQKFPFRVMMQLRLQDTFRCIQITAMSMFDMMLTALTDLRLSERLLDWWTAGQTEDDCHDELLCSYRLELLLSIITFVVVDILGWYWCYMIIINNPMLNKLEWHSVEFIPPPKPDSLQAFTPNPISNSTAQNPEPP